MDSHDILPYILSFIKKYSKKICLVSKFWDMMYIKSTKIYKIEIEFKKNISNENFLRIINSYRFKDILSLNISYTSIKSIPKNNKLVKLDISYCDYITKINRLNKIEILNISKCDKLVKLPFSSINTLTKLYADDCEKLKNLYDFKKLEILLLTYNNIKELPANIYKTIKELMVNYCGDLFILDNFTRLKKLKIVSCPNIRNIPACETLEILYLELYENIILPNFKKIKKISLKYCSDIIIPNILANTLEKLYIFDCDNIILSNSFTKTNIIRITVLPTLVW